MTMGLDGLGQHRSGINVTPLIDVLLVLLVIFIMVAPILTVALPSAIPQKSDQPLPADLAEQQLVVRVCTGGHVLLNRDSLAPERLVERLREVHALRGGGRWVVFVDGDPQVDYGAVVAVMDLCRDAGVETIAVIPDSLGPVR